MSLIDGEADTININSISKLCKLRDTSGSFVLYFIYGMVLVSSMYESIVNTQVHNMSPSRARVLHIYFEFLI